MKAQALQSPLSPAGLDTDSIRDFEPIVLAKKKNYAREAQGHPTGNRHLRVSLVHRGPEK